VFGFFQRVPAPELLQVGCSTLYPLRVAQHGGWPLIAVKCSIATVTASCLSAEKFFCTKRMRFLTRVSRWLMSYPQIAQSVVIIDVFTAVMAFLTNKTANLLLQDRIGYLIAKVPDRVDKKRSPSGNNTDMALKKCVLNGSLLCQWRGNGSGKLKSMCLGRIVRFGGRQAGHGNSWFCGQHVPLLLCIPRNSI